jgi:hypothetical protein
MRRFAFYLTFTFFVFGIFSSNSVQIAYGQKSKQRSFYIESQSDSPLLIRDLTATILPVNDFTSSPSLEVAFYVENVSNKKVKRFYYHSPAEKDFNYKENYIEGSGGPNLLPDEFIRLTTSWNDVDGESLIFRIKEVEFEDGTIWKAKPFNAAKAKKSSRITAVVQKLNDGTNPKRTLMREWMTLIIEDRVLRVFDAAPETIEGVKVQVKRHLLSKLERLDEVETCEIQNDELEKAYDKTDFDVEEFTTYEIKGKVFAYSIHYELIEAKNQYKIGAGIQQIYVDEDGSGYFKVRCNEMDLKSMPQWVKTLAEK